MVFVNRNQHRGGQPTAIRPDAEPAGTSGVAVREWRGYARSAGHERVPSARPPSTSPLRNLATSPGGSGIPLTWSSFVRWTSVSTTWPGANRSFRAAYANGGIGASAPGSERGSDVGCAHTSPLSRRPQPGVVEVLREKAGNYVRMRGCSRYEWLVHGRRTRSLLQHGNEIHYQTAGTPNRNGAVAARIPFTESSCDRRWSDRCEVRCHRGQWLPCTCPVRFRRGAAAAFVVSALRLGAGGRVDAPPIGAKCPSQARKSSRCPIFHRTIVCALHPRPAQQRGRSYCGPRIRTRAQPAGDLSEELERLLNGNPG